MHYYQRSKQPAPEAHADIVISGCGPMVLVEAEAAGANVCLEKPISIDLFWSAMDKVFGAPQAGEREERPEAGEDRGRALAGEIDDLVETLRNCTNKVEKEDTLKRLRHGFSRFNAKNKLCLTNTPVSQTRTKLGRFVSNTRATVVRRPVSPTRATLAE